MTTTKLKIAEFRRVVDSLNWNRHALGGATSSEFISMDVKAILEKHIQGVESLVPFVPVRFAADIEAAHKAIAFANKCIARWVQRVEDGKEPERAPPRAVRRAFGLYLVH